MEVNNIGYKNSFKGLKIKNLAQNHTKFVTPNMENLKNLGEKYDIFLQSSIDKDAMYSGIEVIVKPLRKNLPFFDRLFCRPEGYSFFFTEFPYGEDIVIHTEKAIKDLCDAAPIRVK